MAWIESHQDLRDHPKTDHLMDLLGITRRDAVGLLHFIWWRALTYAPSGDLSAFTDGQVARWAEWDGDASMLIEALTAAGFMDGQRVLHDWQDYAGRWIDRREANAARMRQARAARSGTRNGLAEHVREMSGERATHVQGLPDLTGPDLNRTGPDLNLPPNPPPQAEGGLAKPSGRRRRRDSDAVATVPLTPADEAQWRQALGYMERAVMPSLFTGLVSRLEPVARAEDGGLLLRAPPRLRGDAVTYAHVVRNALEKVGDAAANRAAIVD